jgi:hypothetical protein
MPRDRKTARKSTGGAALCKKVRIEEVPKEQEIALVGVSLSKHPTHHHKLCHPYYGMDQEEIH